MGGLIAARAWIAAAAAALVTVAAAAQDQPAAGARSPLGLASAVPAASVVCVETADIGGLIDALRRQLAVEVADLPPRARGRLSALFAAVRMWTGESAEDLLAALAGVPLALAVVADDDGVFPLVLARIVDADFGARLARRLGAHVPVSWRRGVLAIAPRPQHLPALAGAGDDGRTPAPQGTFGGSLPCAGLRLSVDLARLRGGRAPLWQRARPGQRLLLGPLAHVLDHAQRFVGVLQCGDAGFAFDGEFDASPLAPAPAALLLPHGGAPRAAPPLPADALGVLSLDRSLLAFLTHLDDLLDAEAAASVRANLSLVDTLLGGASLLDDLLPGIVEPMTLVVLAQEPAADPPPRIQLPGFALIAGLRGDAAHELLARGARTAFLVNIGERVQRGQRPFLLRRDTIGDAAALIIEPGEWRGEGDPPIEYNLAITLVAAHGHVVLATTREAAARVVAALAAGGTASRLRGDVLVVDGVQLADLLSRHTDLLALNAVLEQGKSLAEAGADLQLVELVLRRLPRVEVAVVPAPQRTRVLLRVSGGRRPR